MPLPNPVLQHGANAEQDSGALMCVVCSDAVLYLTRAYTRTRFVLNQTPPAGRDDKPASWHRA